MPQEKPKTEQQITQDQIKQAVASPTNQQDTYISPQTPQYQETQPTDQSQYQPPTQTPQQSYQYQEQQNMQPSVLDQQPLPPSAPSPNQDYNQSYSQQPYQDQQYDYQQYSAAPPISSDTITEIAEQVVSEKLSGIRNLLEKTTDIKSTADAKLSHLDERLQRIEKIIDRLQLSILQKVGNQMTSVSDLKKELQETQKSFKALSPKTHHAAHHTTKKHSKRKKK
jgi:hypothetical protein